MLFFFFALLDNVQMLSHGSADLILEACTDFWDGTDIYPLSGSDRSVFGFLFVLEVNIVTLSKCTQ